MTKRKSKTTLAEKINVHVEGEEPFDRFAYLMRRLVPPEQPAGNEDKASEEQPKKKQNHKRSTAREP